MPASPTSPMPLVPVGVRRSGPPTNDDVDVGHVGVDRDEVVAEGRVGDPARAGVGDRLLEERLADAADGAADDLAAGELLVEDPPAVDDRDDRARSGSGRGRGRRGPRRTSPRRRPTAPCRAPADRAACSRRRRSARSARGGPARRRRARRRCRPSSPNRSSSAGQASVDGVAERAGEARAAGGRRPRHVGVAEPDADLVELEPEQLGRELLHDGVGPGADVVGRRCARTRCRRRRSSPAPGSGPATTGS